MSSSRGMLEIIIPVSEHEIYHHFHTFPLDMEFVNTRERLQSNTLSLIQSIPPSKPQLLISQKSRMNELLGMLRHYGIYNGLHVLCRPSPSKGSMLYMDDYFDSIIALENTQLCDEEVFHRQKKWSSVFLFTECIGTNNFKFANMIFGDFLQQCVQTVICTQIKTRSHCNLAAV